MNENLFGPVLYAVVLSACKALTGKNPSEESAYTFSTPEETTDGAFVMDIECLGAQGKGEELAEMLAEMLPEYGLQAELYPGSVGVRVSFVTFLEEQP